MIWKMNDMTTKGEILIFWHYMTKSCEIIVNQKVIEEMASWILRGSSLVINNFKDEFTVKILSLCMAHVEIPN